MLRKPLVILLFDIVLINLCIISVFSVRFIGSAPPARNVQAYLTTWYYISAIFIFLIYLHGLYDFDETDDGVSIFFKMFSVTTIGTISLMALSFFSRAFAFPRTVILISYLVLLLLMSVWRLFVQKKFLESLPPRRAVVFGNPDRFDILRNFMAKNIRRYEFVEGVDYGEEKKLDSILESGRADCVLITDGVPRAQDMAFDLLLKYTGAIIYLIPNPSNIIAGTRHQIVLGDVPLIALSHKTILGRLFLMKRIMDLSLSALALAVFSPLFLLAVIGIKITSPGPAFYTQPRVGKDGRLFSIIKFRTMATDAEEQTGPMLSSDDDPRVTPFGRILRRFKIDEMPQFINVIRGDMSIVGPRPERPFFVEKFEEEYPGYSERKKVLPGITGLAQVNGYYETDPSIKLKYDLMYIHDYHPLMDIAIMYRTVQFVARENV